MSLLKPGECVFCRRCFATSQELISHLLAFHTDNPFSTLISSSSVATAAATTNFHQYPHQNQNPNFDFSHLGAFHTDNPFSILISSSSVATAAATTSFHQYPHQNQNPNFDFSHHGAFHTNSHSSSSAAATTNFYQFPHQNQNPNSGFSARNPIQEFPVRNPTLDFPVRNPFDLNSYHGGSFNNQRRFQREFPPTPGGTPTRNYNHWLSKPIDLSLATSPEDVRTLPLLSQLEKPWPENTETENNGIKSSSIDLSLKL